MPVRWLSRAASGPRICYATHVDDDLAAVGRLREDLERRIEALEAELRALRRRRDAATALLGELPAHDTPVTVTDMSMLPETAAAVSYHTAQSDGLRTLARAGWTLRRLERALRAYGDIAAQPSPEAVEAAVAAGVPRAEAERVAVAGDPNLAGVGVSYVHLSRLLSGQYPWRDTLRSAIRAITGVTV